MHYAHVSNCQNFSQYQVEVQTAAVQKTNLRRCKHSRVSVQSAHGYKNACINTDVSMHV